MPQAGNIYLKGSGNQTGLYIDSINSRILAGSQANVSPYTDVETDVTGNVNQTGKTLTLAGGAGTGTGGGGGISFGTFPPDGANAITVNSTYEEKMAMDKDGNLQLDGSVEPVGGILLDGNTITGIDDSSEFTDDDNHIMTSAAIADRFLTTTGNAATATALTSGDKTISGDLTITGAIELGHASDTTLARSASGTVTIEGNPIVTTVGSSMTFPSGTTDVPMTTFQLRKTLSTADMNSLHTTEVVLHNGVGANGLVMPIGGVMRVDRAATNTNTPSLNIHYSGLTGAYGSTSIVHFRRFMNSVTTDAVFSLTPNTFGSRHVENLTSDVNNKLVITSDGAFTTNCFTSVDIFLTYQ